MLIPITVNLWGALVYAIGAWLSDKYKARVTIMLVCAPIGMVGYAILVAWDVPAGVQYFSTYLIATACFLCTGGNIAWLSGNRAPDGKRAASLGIQLTLTNIGGVVVCLILARRKAGSTDKTSGWPDLSNQFGSGIQARPWLVVGMSCVCVVRMVGVDLPVQEERDMEGSDVG